MSRYQWISGSQTEHPKIIIYSYRYLFLKANLTFFKLHVVMLPGSFRYGYNEAPWASKINWTMQCNWPSKQARWLCLACLGLNAVSCKKMVFFTITYNKSFRWPRLISLRWLDIGLILFFSCLLTSTPSWSINMQKRSLPISSHLNLTLGQQPICMYR